MLGDRMRRRLERLLDEAEEAADIKDWQRVRDIADEVLIVDADNVDAKDFLALSEGSLAALDNAISGFFFVISGNNCCDSFSDVYNGINERQDGFIVAKTL